MLRHVSIAVLVLTLGSARARADEGARRGEEPEVLVAPGVRHGGWGAPVVTLSTVRDQAALFVGGRGGWIIDGRLTIGGGGVGLVNDVSAPRALQPVAGRHDLSVGYGGLWLEYTFRPLRLVHLSIGTLLGGGGMDLVLRDGGDVGLDDAFFVAEPAAALELNVSRSVRADVALSYRWVTGLDLGGEVDDDDLSAFGGALIVKFGSF